MDSPKLKCSGKFGFVCYNHLAWEVERGGDRQKDSQPQSSLIIINNIIGASPERCYYVMALLTGF